VGGESPGWGLHVAMCVGGLYMLFITRSSGRLVVVGGYGALGKGWNSTRTSGEGLPL
jgi:hypothetical protein